MISSATLRYALVVIALLATVGFANAQPDKNSTDPFEQGLARFTGYRAWHGLRKGWDMEVIDSVTLFSVIGTLVGAGLSIRYGHLSADPSHLNKAQQSSRLFTAVIGWYTIGTLLTVSGFFVVDIGKLWTSLGALHNLTEVTILLTLLFEVHTKSFKYIYTLQFVYVCVVFFIVMVLPWPADALFFKLQGLIIDYALVTQFVRLYIVNKKVEYLPRGPRHGEADGLLANDERLETGNSIIEEEILQTEPHLATDDIKILIVAAVIHLIGNIIATLFVDEFWPFALFQFTYAITFPLYGFYVYRQPVIPQIEMKWYKSTWCSEILVGTVCTLLSIVTIVFTLLLSAVRN